ncbi:MAG: hypothetical protein AABY22_30930 [Nanoarchaeota archaeon]
MKKKEEHKHLFKKIAEGNVIRDEKESMEEIFNMKMPSLSKGKKWGKVKQFVALYKCACEETQRFMDVEGGEYNKTLPDTFNL